MLAAGLSVLGRLSVVTEPTLYQRIGGHETLRRLVHEFYKGVAEDPPLREMYPESDLGPAEERLRMFLEQYWGGPKTYQEQRGHPRLRMRHLPFAVTPRQRDRWLHHMLRALSTLELDAADAAAMRDYFEYAAQFMVNSED